MNGDKKRLYAEAPPGIFVTFGAPHNECRAIPECNMVELYVSARIFCVISGISVNVMKHFIHFCPRWSRV